MNTNINLVLPQDKDFLEQQKKIRIANIIAISSPIMIGIVSLIVFLFTQSINPTGIKRQQEDTMSQISELQDRSIKLSIINNRLDNISGLLKNRGDLSESINSLLSIMPIEIAIQNLEIDNKRLTLTVSSTSLRAIDELINNLIAMAEKREVISSISLGTLTFDDSGNSYSVSLTSDL
ncbi:MAG: hypothetical protein HYT07_03940 [Candidatus Levybacteria bacterium]|nr:hypothetical protein [Candidatus Levybacteria bacterium]